MRIRQIPGAPALLLAVAIARLGVPALSLAMLLTAREASGGYGTAGAVGAAYALAVAIFQLGWGRAADRAGSAGVVRRTALAHGAALALFAALAEAGVSAALIPAAALAGACFPPVATVSRAAWRAVEGEDERRALFALDGVTTEVTLIAGPLVATALVAIAGAPAAVAIVAAMVAVAALAAAASPLLSRGSDDGPAAGNEPVLTGTVRSSLPRFSPSLVTLLTATVAMAAALGAATVAGVVFADQAGLPAGLPLTLMAVGGVAGALAWGARELPLDRRAQLVVGLGLYAAVMLAAATTPDRTVLALLVAAGALMAPCDALQAQLCGELAPHARAAESFAWLNSANWVGYAAGTLLTGALVDATEAAGGFVACAAAAAAAAAIAARRGPGALRAPA
jgi:MFS family permease